MITLISIAILALAYILTSLIGWVISHILKIDLCTDEKPISTMNFMIGLLSISLVLFTIALIIVLNSNVQNFFLK